MKRLLAVDPAEWEAEAARNEAFLATFGDRLPVALKLQHQCLLARLKGAR